MYNFLIKLVALSIISSNLLAQPVYFQPPQGTSTTTNTSSLPPASILSPDQFKNKVNNLDQQNQAARATRLEQLSNALPQPLAPPAPKESIITKEQATGSAPKPANVPPTAPAAPPAAAAQPAPQTPAEPAQPQAQPYTPSFQSNSPSSPPASDGGNWNIKY